MSYRRRKGSLDLRRASLAKLGEHLEDARDRVRKLESSLGEYQRRVTVAPFNLNEIEQRISTISEQLLRLREVRKTRNGVLGKLLGLTEMPTENKSKIASLEKELSDLRHWQSELKQVGRYIQSCETSLASAYSWHTKLGEAIERKRRKKEALTELRARAAKSLKESRKLGTSVRRRLRKQPWCPYCGEALGSDPHVDHIYPVSKGGMSVAKNMVYVCSICNGMKKNLTLTAFIRKHGLDRDAIERRLDELGKEF